MEEGRGGGGEGWRRGGVEEGEGWRRGGGVEENGYELELQLGTKPFWSHSWILLNGSLYWNVQL